MPGRTSRPSPPVGLVSSQSELGSRVRKVVRAAGFPIAFDLTADRLEEVLSSGSIDQVASVLVLSDKLQSTDASTFFRVRRAFAKERLVLCAERTDAATIRWVIGNGADGLVWDTEIDAALELTIRTVVAGQLVTPPELRGPLNPQLTNREKQVLSLVIMGLSNAEIAQKLFISESTVKSHLNTAYRRLGVNSRSEAARRITDPDEGLGTGILAITGPGIQRSRARKS
jgi:DNA-binding NarL/FixJ family response regulator